jgi:hypothetical protein
MEVNMCVSNCTTANGYVAGFDVIEWCRGGGRDGTVCGQDRHLPVCEGELRSAWERSERGWSSVPHTDHHDREMPWWGDGKYEER